RSSGLPGDLRRWQLTQQGILLGRPRTPRLWRQGSAASVRLRLLVPGLLRVTELPPLGEDSLDARAGVGDASSRLGGCPRRAAPRPSAARPRIFLAPLRPAGDHPPVGTGCRATPPILPRGPLLLFGGGNYSPPISTESWVVAAGGCKPVVKYLALKGTGEA